MDPPAGQTSAASAVPRHAKNRKRLVSIIIAAIIVVIIIIMLVAIPRARNSEKCLSGFWTGETAFLRRAGLSEMFLYIAPPESGWGRNNRQGYLLMVDNEGETVSNQGIELSYGSAFSRWSSSLKSHFSNAPRETYKIASVDIAYDDEAVMPEKVSIGVNTSDGTLALYDKDKIYAFLVRDNEVSTAANEAYGESDDESDSDSVPL
jgi:hypothetical protein